MLKRISLLFFVPLSLLCAQTQSEMNAQARADFERADAELHKTYDALLARLTDAETKQRLEASQRAWIAFCDAEASFAADQVRGGSTAPVWRYVSMTESTEQRIRRLKNAIRSAPRHVTRALRERVNVAAEPASYSNIALGEADPPSLKTWRRVASLAGV